MGRIKKRLGEKIRYIRKERGFTQEKLAEISNIDFTTLNKIENGKRSASLSTIEKIARALKIAVNELFSG